MKPHDLLMEGVKFKEAKQNDRGAPGTQLLLYFMQKKYWTYLVVLEGEREVRYLEILEL